MDKEQRIEEILLKASEVKTYFRDEHQDRPYISRWTEEYAKQVACQISQLVPQGDDEGLLTEHFKLMHFGWLLGEAKMGKHITNDELLWLVEDAGKEFIAKAQRDLTRQEIPIAVKAERERIINWMSELCPHTGGLEEQQMYKSDCPKCWQSLKGE